MAASENGEKQANQDHEPAQALTTDWSYAFHRGIAGIKISLLKSGEPGLGQRISKQHPASGH
jgi:hypothetical protein